MFFDGQIINRQILVRCPRDPGSPIRKMAIRVMWSDRIGWIVRNCFGCDQLNGNICNHCCAAITLMFRNDPELRPLEPIEVPPPGAR